ncbi:uncharacterized protein A1O5_10607 [Cladophialophora psammophila CBS 110553]|uniref:SnoaL-like domain-containing protein n=1 Tax=Cladophialophora psammophila CBS 110553 TaxID=1182543 RepID=W9WN72_9EURO|nr:uncharacterized protein A1O5_10607 [Cladophialophora psammophila CBS 110553]EXJ66455.1 hypothetical protein A1O5_10607 [Cladophialophora psammophila CBS 110553]
MSDLTPSRGLSIIDRWIDAWNRNDPAAWIALYSLSAKYTDHAYQIIRIGPSTLKEHWTIWRTAHPDFVIQIESSWPYEELPGGRCRYSIRTANRGTFINDLPRSKATGKPFWFRGCVNIVVNLSTGLIEEVEEWYCPNLERTTALTDYHRKADGELKLERL